jgi:hypothetical protein
MGLKLMLGPPDVFQRRHPGFKSSLLKLSNNQKKKKKWMPGIFFLNFEILT